MHAVGIVAAAGSGLRLGADARRRWSRSVAGRSSAGRWTPCAPAASSDVVVAVPADEHAAFAAACRRTCGSSTAGRPAPRRCAPRSRPPRTGSTSSSCTTPPARWPRPRGRRVLAALAGGARAVVPVLPVADTTVVVDDDGVITGAAAARALRRVQTPQGFTAPCSTPPTPHAAADGVELTDDAASCAPPASRCTTVAGRRAGRQDHRRARPRARRAAGRRSMHRPAPGRASAPTCTRSSPAAPCWLAGLDWPGVDGCAGHSDGDVAAHALSDAVLSAAGLGDLGGLLGTDDPRWAGASGIAVLEHVREVLAAAGWRVGNASVQVIATTPEAGPPPGRGRGGAVRRARRPGQRQRHHDRRPRADRPRRGPGRGRDRPGGPDGGDARRRPDGALRRLPPVSLRLYDTAARAVRDFTPLRAGQASVYVCGLTVQGPPHIGHVRAALAFDVLRRWLTARRARRHLVRNVTDIDDKILAKADAHGVPWWAWAYDERARLHPRLRRPRLPAAHLRAAGHRARPRDGRADGAADRARARLRRRRRRLLRRPLVPGVRRAVRPEARRPAVGRRHRHRRPQARPRDFALWKAPRTASRDRLLADPVGPRPAGLAPGVLRDGRALPRRRVRHPRRRPGPALPAPRERAGPVARGRRRLRPLLAAQRLGHPRRREDEQVAGQHRAGRRGRPARPARSSCATTWSRRTTGRRSSSPTRRWRRPPPAYRRIESFVRRAAERVGADAGSRVLCADFADAMDDDLGTPAALAAIHDTVREGNAALADGDDARCRRHARLGARDARRPRPRPARPAVGRRRRATTG